MPIPLILDGSSLKGTIAVAGYAALNIVYRIALPEKTGDWQAALKGKGKARVDAACALFEGNLISWDLDAPCTAETWRKLPMPVLDKLENKLTGWDVEGDEKNSATG